jgi:hypothetical protein
LNLGTSNLPLMTRQSYRFELIHALSFPASIAMIEGAVVGVLAKKTFEVEPIQYSLIWAAPMFANLTSFLWTRIARGWPKVLVITLLGLGVLGVLVGIAFLPMNPAGAAGLTALVILGRCLLAGIITLRSTIWRMNYPRNLRGRITGRLTAFMTLTIALAAPLTYALQDYDERAFRLIYPLCAIWGLIGVWSFSRVRLRQQRSLLRFEQRQHEPADTAPARDAPAVPCESPAALSAKGPNRTAGPKSLDRTPPERVPRTPWALLLWDGDFRRYMTWQFFAGIANMTGEAVIVYRIYELTEGMKREYFISVLLGLSVPMLIATISLPLWARWLDGLHITRFRVRQSRFWIADQAVNLVGALSGLLGVIAVGRLIQGFARGGGVLAWQLGHNDFADQRLVPLYMGAHQTLTGIRGLIAPIAGIALYTGDWWILGQWPAMGAYIFLLTVGSAVISSIGFWHLSRRMNAHKAPEIA